VVRAATDGLSLRATSLRRRGDERQRPGGRRSPTTVPPADQVFTRGRRRPGCRRPGTARLPPAVVLRHAQGRRRQRGRRDSTAPRFDASFFIYLAPHTCSQ